MGTVFHQGIYNCKTGVMRTKKIFEKPMAHVVPHIGNLSNKEIAGLSDEDLAEYFKENRFAREVRLYKANEDYLLREIVGEYILVPVGSGAEQLNGMLGLNETFQFVWNQFQNPHTVYDVVLAAKEQFLDSKGMMEKDICDCVRECLQYGFLKEWEEA